MLPSTLYVPCVYLARTLYVSYILYLIHTKVWSLEQTWDKPGTGTNLGLEQTWDKPGTRTDLRQNWDWDKPEIRNTWMGDNLMHKEPDLACTMETI